MLPGMANTEQVSAALRWGGRVLAVGGAISGFMPVGDECGSVFQPLGLDADSPLCVSVLAGRQNLTVALLVLGVAAMIAGQVVQWRLRRGRQQT
jgi:hypothetical protein